MTLNLGFCACTVKAKQLINNKNVIFLSKRFIFDNSEIKIGYLFDSFKISYIGTIATHKKEYCFCFLNLIGSDSSRFIGTKAESKTSLANGEVLLIF